MSAGNGCAHTNLTTDFSTGKVVCADCGNETAFEGTVTTGTLGPDGTVIPDDDDDKK